MIYIEQSNPLKSQSLLDKKYVIVSLKSLILKLYEDKVVGMIRGDLTCGLVLYFRIGSGSWQERM